jgi:hypothetical protein
MRFRMVVVNDLNQNVPAWSEENISIDLPAGQIFGGITHQPNLPLMPKRRRSSLIHCWRPRPRLTGLRFGLSRQLRVVIAIPSPSKNHTPTLADFITATSGFELSVHTTAANN